MESKRSNCKLIELLQGYLQQIQPWFVCHSHIVILTKDKEFNLRRPVLSASIFEESIKTTRKTAHGNVVVDWFYNADQGKIQVAMKTFIMLLRTWILFFV